MTEDSKKHGGGGGVWSWFSFWLSKMKKNKEGCAKKCPENHQNDVS
jgi:hypothetical protein